ncbi:MAG: hypothetical protein KDD70_18690 [Bdellovibrionales bacterium]|nr:hypothetical protein [Bdellovibrionales bacterium]
MIIRTADPHELTALASFFEREFHPKNHSFLKKLSYCLARGTCYVTGADEIAGAVIFDNDFFGLERIVAIKADSSEDYRALLTHVRSQSPTEELFLGISSEDNPLSEAAKALGFQFSGEIRINSQPIQVYSLPAAV